MENIAKTATTLYAKLMNNISAPKVKTIMISVISMLIATILSRVNFSKREKTSSSDKSEDIQDYESQRQMLEDQAQTLKNLRTKLNNPAHKKEVESFIKQQKKTIDKQKKDIESLNKKRDDQAQRLEAAYAVLGAYYRRDPDVFYSA